MLPAWLRALSLAFLPLVSHALGSSLAAAGPAGLQDGPPAGSAQEAAATEIGRDIAARAGRDALSWEELDALLLDRHGRSQQGRDALLHLLKSRMLERLERERGLAISPARVEERWKEIDREVRRSGDQGGVAAMLRKNRISPEFFRRFLRLSIVQETLARKALGIAEGQPISGEQQEMWLEGVLSERGIEELDPARSGGAILRCGDVEITRAEFGQHLRTQADAADVQDACYQLLLLKRMRARLADLTPEAIERGVQEEIERRRREAELDPRYAGISFEQLLGAQGMSLDTLRTDPSVRIAALARLWVERHFDAARLREVYLTERENYDRLFGEALELSVLLLRAGRFKNELVPRTFDEARTLLRDLAADVRNRADFERLVQARSEDPESRERSGLIGYATRGDPRVPAPLRAAAFAALDAGTFTPGALADDARARLVGPVQTPGGCVLLWIGDRRPAPVWDAMAVHVRAEQRREFVEGLLRPDQVVTFLDAP